MQCSAHAKSHINNSQIYAKIPITATPHVRAISSKTNWRQKKHYSGLMSSSMGRGLKPSP